MAVSRCPFWGDILHLSLPGLQLTVPQYSTCPPYDAWPGHDNPAKSRNTVSAIQWRCYLKLCRKKWCKMIEAFWNDRLSAQFEIRAFYPLKNEIKFCSKNIFMSTSIFDFSQLSTHHLTIIIFRIYTEHTVMNLLKFRPNSKILHPENLYFLWNNEIGPIVSSNLKMRLLRDLVFAVKDSGYNIY